MYMVDINKFIGKWLVPDISPEFSKILKAIGYTTMERHYFKKSTVYIYSTIKDNILTLRIDSPFYKNTREYPLNFEPVEYLNEKKLQVIEMTGFINSNTIETKTIYPESGITLIDTREILENGDCFHKLSLHQGFDEPIVTQVTYTKINE